MALPLKCQHMAPRSLPVAGVTRRRGEPPRPRGLDAREHMVRGPSATRPPPAGREGQGRTARRVSVARPRHAPWTCEAEGEGEPRWMQA